jgi:hypothetical protein
MIDSIVRFVYIVHMNYQTIKASDFRTKVADVLNDVQYNATHYSIERHGKVVATLSPSIPEKRKTFSDFFGVIPDLKVKRKRVFGRKAEFDSE